MTKKPQKTQTKLKISKPSQNFIIYNPFLKIHFKSVTNSHFPNLYGEIGS